jgi:DNA processing protein
MKPISILSLQQIPRVGSKTVEKILSISDIPEPTCYDDLIEILKNANAKFGRIKIPDSHDAKNAWDKAHEILKLSEQQNIEIISRESSYYPECLSLIDNPPILLHVKGNIKALNKDSIAIVGTRKPSSYGKTQAKKIAGLFADEKFVIVSGLAEGVDSAAHIGALEADGLTVAVLAHGLDTIYPYTNKQLADAIIKNDGALISEYPLGTKIFHSYFVERNRIQSGLSLGVLVIETGINGGTMHTVGFCEKQKRVLIVMKHPPNLLEATKQCGNTQLITDNRANIVFDTVDNLILAKDLMQKKKDELFMPKSTPQISSLGDLKELKMKTSELLTAHTSSNDYKDEIFGFVSASKLIPPSQSVGFKQRAKNKKKGKRKIDENQKIFGD